MGAFLAIFIYDLTVVAIDGNNVNLGCYMQGLQMAEWWNSSKHLRVPYQNQMNPRFVLQRYQG
jgi:hypothetical protein